MFELSRIRHGPGGASHESSTQHLLSSKRAASKGPFFVEPKGKGAFEHPVCVYEGGAWTFSWLSPFVHILVSSDRF